MTITINNRELLRNYKSIKARLRSGQIKEVKIEQEDGFELVLVGRKTKNYKTAFQALVEEIQKSPIHITRPSADLFDERA